MYPTSGSLCVYHVRRGIRRSKGSVQRGSFSYPPPPSSVDNRTANRLPSPFRVSTSICPPISSVTRRVRVSEVTIPRIPQFEAGSEFASMIRLNNSTRLDKGGFHVASSHRSRKQGRPPIPQSSYAAAGAAFSCGELSEFVPTDSSRRWIRCSICSMVSSCRSIASCCSFNASTSTGITLL